LGGVAGAAILPAISRIGNAQAYPARPITIIVPYAAGGASDVIGRVLADRMAKSLGQPFIVENISGADGNLGVGRAVRARPDGYTIDLGSLTTHILNAGFYSLQYDALNDFAPISLVATSSRVLFAKKAVPANDLNELIAWLKTNSNKASAGATSVEVRLLSALFQKETGTQFALVPYRGIAPAMQDLVAGQIDLIFEPADSLSLVRAGNIKAYAVTGDARLAVAPDLPTFGELGLTTLSYMAWVGLFAPKGTSPDIVGKLNGAAVEAMADPVVRMRLADIGFEVVPRAKQTHDTLAAVQKADAEKWWPIIKELGIRG
jgi:tripartite-type tricarboxylate transporter receptor subunit TctC